MSLLRAIALAAAAVVAFAAGAEPAAWRVAGSNGGEIVLLGSIHVLRASDHPLPESIDRLVDRAETIVMELDLDDLDPARQQNAILGTAVLPDGMQLADVIDADLYRLLETRAADVGIDLSLLTRFEPWFLSITLLDLGMRQLGFTPERGIEQYVLRRSSSADKEIVGLETIEFQIGIFDALSPSSQEAMLAQTLTELDEAETAMVAMAEAWRAGDLEPLSHELLDDFEEFPGLYASLVTDRNAAWVDSLEDLLEAGERYLVVVGALHLVGRDNVIDMLTARGHAVERIH